MKTFWSVQCLDLAGPDQSRCTHRTLWSRRFDIWSFATLEILSGALDWCFRIDHIPSDYVKIAGWWFWPYWKILVNGKDYPIYYGKHVPNHQPENDPVEIRRNSWISHKKTGDVPPFFVCLPGRVDLTFWPTSAPISSLCELRQLRHQTWPWKKYLDFSRLMWISREETIFFMLYSFLTSAKWSIQVLDPRFWVHSAQQDQFNLGFQKNVPFWIVHERINSSIFVG